MPEQVKLQQFPRFHLTSPPVRSTHFTIFLNSETLFWFGFRIMLVVQNLRRFDGWR
jgi:hypothetical protein